MASSIEHQASRDGVLEPVDNGMRLTGKRKLALGILAALVVCQVGAVVLPTPYFILEASDGSPQRERAPLVLTALYLFFFFKNFGWLIALGLIVLGGLVWTGRLDRFADRVGRAWSKLHLESGIGNL